MTYTTIQVEKETREKLADLKEYNRETYDEIIRRLVKVFEVVRDEEGELTEETRKAIEEGLRQADGKKGMTTKQLLKKLGVE